MVVDNQELLTTLNHFSKNFTIEDLQMKFKNLVDKLFETVIFLFIT
jgi:hypothetical protein